MNSSQDYTTRAANPGDAKALALHIDIAGEGIPSWLWAQSADDSQSPIDVGIDRARRDTGGFSYRTAFVVERAGQVLGMALSYPIDNAPDTDTSALPTPIVPFIELEAQSVGTWYVNALAARAGSRGVGVGSHLMADVEHRARKAGYGTLSIQVYAQNIGAVRLYQRLGFKTVGQAPVLQHPCQPYYTGDVLLLTKQIKTNGHI